jgi:general secretion pathway protein E
MINNKKLQELIAEVKKQNPTSLDRLIEYIIQTAIDMRASDIHIEPYDDEALLRYRVDGVLLEISCFEYSIFLPLVSKIKILADMDIAEKRKAQDGRISQTSSQREIDMRVSTLPTICGESVAIRLLDQKSSMLDISSLGLSNANKEKLKCTLKNSHGIILVTGATGSGKTTTLYSVLSEIKSNEKKIITVEDPVEYKLEHIQQVQTNEKAGLGFANALRSILRQDPDVIMIGEIRDEDTLKIAIQASLTGHLVFSTLHTNMAISAISRLMDMGAKSYLLADSLRCVIAQRLVRTLCECKEKYQVALIPAEFQDYFALEDEIYHAKGCPKCAHSGYFGREMICEILTITPELSALISAKEDSKKMSEQALRDGFCNMLQDGINSVKEGRTSIDELTRVVWFEAI